MPPNGTLQVRSDFSSVTRTTTTALGTGWHNVELCGTVGSATSWNLYRDGTQILTNWVADTGTTPVGRIQIGDTAAKTFTVNFDHVVLDTAPGDDVAGDTTAPSVPGRPAGSSPAAGSIQISWAASTDPAPASLPITYRIYRDGGATSVGSTTTTSFTDTGLVSGSSHTYTVDAIDAANNVSAKSLASLSITVSAAADTTPPTVPGQPSGTSPSTSSIQISWAASTDATPPITYRVYRDGGATSIGSTTTTSFTDTGLVAGSSHTYTVDAVDALNHASNKSPASAPIVVSTSVSGGQPKPGHTTLVPDVPRNNVPRIMTGEIWDIEYIGNHVYIAGTFTGIQNNTATNTTSYNQPYLASYNIDTGLVDTAFRPTFGGGGVTEIEASPDGTKLFAVGRFNTVNGVTKRKVVSLNPTTGAVNTGFTANANSAATAVDATNTTVYIGGQFTTVNNIPRVSLAAVSATTGAVVTGFVNDLAGGIGVNGALTVQALVLTHDNSKLLVVHTGRQIAGQDRYGIGLIDTATNLLLPWRTRLWDDNLQFVGGVTRIYAGAIAPNDQYFVVSSGSGGDRPPISDVAVAYPMAGGDNVQPLWVSRCFDSVYSVAISETAVYIGGHLLQECPFVWVRRQREGSFVRGGRLLDAAQPPEQVGARGMEQVVGVELLRQPVRERESRVGSVGHRDRDGSIERHDGRGSPFGERPVERGDLWPVGVLGTRRAGVQGRDRRLHLVRAGRAELHRAVERVQTLIDEIAIPAGAILVLQQDERARRIHPGAVPGVLQQHEREEAERLRCVGHEGRQDARQPDRLFAQLHAHERTFGRAVALVEDQVQHGEHAVEPLGQQLAGRDPVRDRGVADLLLRADQPLLDRRLGGDERARDLPRR